MTTRLVLPLTVDTVRGLPVAGRACVTWEVGPVAAERAHREGAAEQVKTDWLTAAAETWGPAGRVVVVDGQTVGYAVVAPPALVPRAAGFATSPVAADAVVLAGLHVSPEHRGRGLGRVLVQAVAKDLMQRDVVAVETFARPDTTRTPAAVAADETDRASAGRAAADTDTDTDIADTDSAGTDVPGTDTATGGHGTGGHGTGGHGTGGHGTGPSACLLPVGFLTAVGFVVVRPHPRHPRLRLDLRSTVRWREDVEGALGRVRRTLTPALRPA